MHKQHVISYQIVVYCKKTNMIRVILTVICYHLGIIGKRIIKQWEYILG